MADHSRPRKDLPAWMTLPGSLVSGPDLGTPETPATGVTGSETDDAPDPVEAASEAGVEGTTGESDDPGGDVTPDAADAQGVNDAATETGVAERAGDGAVHAGGAAFEAGAAVGVDDGPASGPDDPSAPGGDLAAGADAGTASEAGAAVHVSAPPASAADDSLLPGSLPAGAGAAGSGTEERGATRTDEQRTDTSAFAWSEELASGAGEGVDSSPLSSWERGDGLASGSRMGAGNAEPSGTHSHGPVPSSAGAAGSGPEERGATRTDERPSAGPTLPGRDEAERQDDPEVRLKPALEAILMIVDEPVRDVTLAQVLERPTHEVTAALHELAEEYERSGRGFDLRQVAGGWRFYTRPEYASAVERFVRDGQQTRLTQAALETLAVVAYRQPVSRARVAAVRGVNSDGVMRTLVARGLVEEAGTDPESQAVLYRTSSYFLERLGLNDISELPELAPFLPDDVENIEETTK
jgi:segregation and condensation protein B